MKRVLLSLLFLAQAIGALAVMDLQFVRRWNVSGPVIADFRKVVAKPGGGFFAAGVLNQNEDLFVMSLDANANVISSRRWDSPRRGAEVIAGIDVDSNGDGYLLAGGEDQVVTNPLYLVKFDGVTLATEWEKPLTGATDFFSYQVKRSGSSGSEAIYVVASTTSEAKVFRFNPSGAQLSTATFPHSFQINALAAMPVNAQGGIAIGGTNNSKPFIGHVNSAGSILVDHEVNTNNASVTDITASPTGVIIATGGPFAGPLTMYRQTGNNSFATSSRPGYSYGRGVAHVTGSSYLVSAYNGSANSVSPWDSVTGTFQASVTTGSSLGKVRIAANAARYAVGPDFSFGVLSPIGPASTPVGVEIEDVARHGESDLLGVGKNGVLFTPQSATISQGLTVSAYQNRSVVDARSDGQGGVIQLISPISGPGNLQRINAAGEMVWNRVLNAPGVFGQEWSRISTFSNGDYCLVGRGLGGFVIGRVTTAGVVTMAKRVTVPGYGHFAAGDIWADAQNRIWVGGSAPVNQTQTAILVRVNADGSDLQVLEGLGGSNGWRSLRGHPDGSLYVLVGSGPLQLKRLSLDGAQLNSANVSDNFQGTVDVNAQGASVVGGVINDVATITVRDAAFAQQWTATIVAGLAPVVKFAPGGQVRVVYYADGELTIRSYSSTGAVQWTSALPESVLSVRDVDIDMANGWAYLTCAENSFVEADASVNVVRYLANGVRSAQRKTAGKAALGLQSGSSFWALGDVTTRYKGREASSTKWSLP